MEKLSEIIISFKIKQVRFETQQEIRDTGLECDFEDTEEYTKPFFNFLFSSPKKETEEEICLYWANQDVINNYKSYCDAPYGNPTDWPSWYLEEYFNEIGLETIPDPHPSMVIESSKMLTEQILTKYGLHNLKRIILLPKGSKQCIRGWIPAWKLYTEGDLTEEEAQKEFSHNVPTYDCLGIKRSSNTSWLETYFLGYSYGDVKREWKEDTAFLLKGSRKQKEILPGTMTCRAKTSFWSEPKYTQRTIIKLWEAR